MKFYSQVVYSNILNKIIFLGPVPPIFILNSCVGALAFNKVISFKLIYKIKTKSKFHLISMNIIV